MTKYDDSHRKTSTEDVRRVLRNYTERSLVLMTLVILWFSWSSTMRFKLVAWPAAGLERHEIGFNFMTGAS